VGRSIRPLGGVPARKFRLQTGFGVHRSLSPSPGYRCRVDPAGNKGNQPAWRASMWLNGMAESRRKAGRFGGMLKCCKSVANPSQVLPSFITRILCGAGYAVV
jgi:hypothetical protein